MKRSADRSRATPLFSFLFISNTLFCPSSLIPDSMHPRFKNVLLLAAFATSWLQGSAIQSVTRQGRYLYTQDQNRFYIKGISYQEQGAVIASANNNFGEPSTFIDPLSLGSACQRDLPYLQQLGVNTIRVYSVNASLNHDDCMTTFSNAGIYTIIDLSLPLNGSIDRLVPTWSTNLLDSYIATINAFQKYDNVLAYNVGNEVVTTATNPSAPYVKAAGRDIKAYLNSIKSSALVGYASIDGASSWRLDLADYFSCDSSNSNSGSTAIDLYGLNNYEWCGDSSFQASGYATTTSDFQQYNVVAYFSEFGCVNSPPRLWTEVGALFNSSMSPVWSGGIAFSYFPAASADGQFGMVNISSDGSTVTTSGDFSRLQTQYGQISPPNNPSAGSSSSSYPACPSTSSIFNASTTLPPTPNEAACNCLENTLSCRFTPVTSNYSAVVGQLTDTACGLLGQQGANCNDIGGDGVAGTYGRLADCDPTVKLSYVMSLYYELNNRNAQACSFAGNGTVNQSAPSSASAANAAASSCISNPSATFAPTAVSSSSVGATGSSHNSATGLIAHDSTVYGVTAAFIITLGSAFWTMS